VLGKILEYITGGTLVVAFLAMIVFVPHILTGFTIKISERYKPGSWYNKSEATYKWRYRSVAELWGAGLFMAGAWYGMLHVYPFLMSLYHKFGIL